MLQTIITFMLDKPIQVIATIAMLIGGLAAIGYFWEKIIASWKQFCEKRCNVQEKKMAKKNKIRYVLDEPEGQVPLDSLFYVERPPIESDSYETIVKIAALIRIKASWQMGKSSLMIRILHHAEKQGCHTVALNFQQADAPVFEDLDKFLQCAAVNVSRYADLARNAIYEDLPHAE